MEHTQVLVLLMPQKVCVVNELFHRRIFAGMLAVLNRICTGITMGAVSIIFANPMKHTFTQPGN